MQFRPIPWQQGWIWPSSQSQLAALPHSQQDWPNPARALAGVPQGFINVPTQALLTSPVRTLGKKTDWPLPVGKPFTQSMQGHLNVPPPWLLTTSARIQRQTDWPNPRGPEFPISLRFWSLTLVNTTLAQNGPLGVISFKTDWPVPAGRPLTQSMQGHINVPPLSLLTAAIPMASRQLDWPNPRGPEFPQSLRSWLLTLVNTTLGQSGPLGVISFKTDWPNPAYVLPPVSLRFWSQSLNPATPVTLTATGVASVEAFGTGSITGGATDVAVGSAAPSGWFSGEGPGGFKQVVEAPAPRVKPAAVTLAAAGIASAEALGYGLTLALAPRAIRLYAGDVPSAKAFGVHHIKRRPSALQLKDENELLFGIGA